MHTPKQSKHFQAEVAFFVATVRAHRLQGYLCYVFLRYLGERNSTVPFHEDTLIKDIELLLAFLQAVEKEQQRQKSKKADG